jgi:hypothetical protein
MEKRAAIDVKCEATAPEWTEAVRGLETPGPEIV